MSLLLLFHGEDGGAPPVVATSDMTHQMIRRRRGGGGMGAVAGEAEHKEPQIWPTISPYRLPGQEPQPR